MNLLLQQLNQKPIAFYPIYRRMTGSPTAGILLSQLMYWFSKHDKFFHKDSTVMEETALTINELRMAKLKIKDLPFIKVTREGVPAKTYYEIDWVIYEEFSTEFCEKKIKKEEEENSEIHECDSLNSQIAIRGYNEAINKEVENIKNKTIKNVSPSWYDKANIKFTKSLQHAKKIKKNTNSNLWSNQFRLLHERDGMEKSRIKKVLIWYCKLLKSGLPKYTPEAFCGKTFREKFIRLENKMENDQIENEETPPAKIKLTESGKQILSTYQRYIKHPSANTEEYPALSSAIDNYLTKLENEFLSLHLKNNPNRAKKNLREQAKHLVNGLGRNFIYEWYAVWIDNNTSSWQEWSGTMQDFFPYKKHFNRFLSNLTKTYTEINKAEYKELFYGTK